MLLNVINGNQAEALDIQPSLPMGRSEVVCGLRTAQDSFTHPSEPCNGNLIEEANHRQRPLKIVIPVIFFVFPFPFGANIPDS